MPPLHATQTKKQDARNGSKENLRLLFTVQDAVKAACVEGGAWGCWIAGNHARGRGTVGCSSKNYEKLCFPLELELGLSVVGEIHRDGHDGEEGVKQ